MTKEKTKQLSIRVPESLHDKVRQEAEQQKMTITDYVIQELAIASNSKENSYTDHRDGKGEEEQIAIQELQAEIQKLATATQEKDQYIQELTQNHHEQVQELTKLIDQQQKLTLATQQDNEKLAIELKATEQNKRKWWKFWEGSNE